MTITALRLQPVETHADKMRRLRDEAQASALDHTEVFLRVLAELQTIAEDIADGGEAYLVGVRETARKLAPDLHATRLNIASIVGRAA